MYQTKLIRLWKGFTPEEVRRFLKFLQSPYFNTNPIQIDLYHILKKTYPKFTSKKLEKESLYALLYPKKAFSYHHLGNLFSQQFQLVQRFLIQLEMEQDDFQQEKNLLEAYQRKAPYEWFLKRINGLMDDLEDQAYRDTDYYHHLFELKTLYFSHPKTTSFTLKEDVPKEVMDLLDRYYMLSKMHLSVVLKSKEKILAVEYDIKLLPEVLDYVNSDLKTESVLFEIYERLLYLQKEPDQIEVFYKLKNLFIAQIKQLRRGKAREVLFQLLNYAARKINAGHYEFNREIFDLYKIGLTFDFFIENGVMFNEIYANIANVGGVLKEYKWTENFIEDFAIYLNSDTRPYYRALNLAELRFQQNKFDEAIKILNYQSFDNTLLALTARTLLIKNWFEKFLADKNIYPFLFSQITSFEKYLKRESSLSKIKQKGYSNLLKILKKIIDSIQKEIPETKIQEKLIPLINTTQPLMGKNWLMKRLENI